MLDSKLRFSRVSHYYAKSVRATKAPCEEVLLCVRAYKLRLELRGNTMGLGTNLCYVAETYAYIMRPAYGMKDAEISSTIY